MYTSVLIRGKPKAKATPEIICVPYLMTAKFGVIFLEQNEQGGDRAHYPP
jgi:hypothetical protein